MEKMLTDTERICNRLAKFEEFEILKNLTRSNYFLSVSCAHLSDCNKTIIELLRIEADDEGGSF